MRRSKYLMGGVALAVGSAVLAGGIFALRGNGSAALPIYWEAPAFALVDQRGDSLQAADLRGTVWAVSFIFTNCKGVCPLISAKLARVRDTLAADGLLGSDARLISITVDPDRDTPEVLREYAAHFGGSPPSEWAFLTGSPPEAVRRMIQEGFRVTAVDPSAAVPADRSADYQVQHSPRLMVVDPRGRIRGTYDATDGGVVERVAADIRALVE